MMESDIMKNSNGNGGLKEKLKEKAENTQVTTTGENKPLTIYDLIKKMKPEMKNALPKHVDADRLLRIAVTAVRTNPRLLECTQNSLLAGIMLSAQLGLEPNTPLQQAFLIPYKRSIKENDQWYKIMEVQFQLGYQGILDLCYRTKTFKDIYAEGVYAQDKFEYKLGLNRDLIHVPSEADDRGDLTHVYAVYHTINGGYDFKVWTVSKIRKHAQKFSQSYEDKKSVWKANDESFLGMCKKTVLMDLLKYAPKSIELAKQVTQDEVIKHDVEPDMTEAPTIDIDYSVRDSNENNTENMDNKEE